MYDITILHLSDLHIDSEGGTYSEVLDGLIKSITKELEFVTDKSVVLLVTGDIFHKGDKDAYDNALAFFTDLRDEIQDKVVAVYIVPGNHDKFRTNEQKISVPMYRTLRGKTKIQLDKNTDEDIFEKKLFGTEFYNGNWGEIKNAYDKTRYLELTREVYSLFDSKIDSKIIEDTYGVDILPVNGKNYCFILLNTAWSCIDDYDNRQLIFGKFQIDELKSQYDKRCRKKKRENKIALTMALGHHPLQSFYGFEQDKLLDMFVPIKGWGINVYFCGHIHDRKIVNQIVNWHSMSTFVSGIGWPDEDSKSYDHYYSIYGINVDLNSIDVFVRKYKKDKTFYLDNSFYTTGDTTPSDTKVTFPIKVEKTLTNVPLKALDDSDKSSAELYMSQELFDYIRDFGVKHVEYERTIQEILFSYKSKYIEATDDAELPNDKFFYYRSFIVFLTKIANNFIMLFVGNTDARIYSEEDWVRFHFRCLLKKENGQHIYTYLTQFETNNGKDSNTTRVSDAEYDELLVSSNGGPEGLLYSANENHVKRKLDKEKWTNYYSIVPRFSENYPSRDGRGAVKRPYITCGVTVRDKKYDSLLYCLDMFDFEKTIDAVIADYIRTFKINLDDFCKWWTSFLQEQDSECKLND